MIDRRRQLRELYGFDFPDDFFRFWEFVNRLQPLDPLNALLALSIQLVGPFEVLAGRFDQRKPRLSLLLHWRYFLDPPEFFTVLAGGDSLHWGYYLDDPASGRGCIASYYTHDAFEMSVDGDDLFQAVRLYLEELQVDCELDHADGMLSDDELAETLSGLASLRSALMTFATEDRAETAASYVDRYSGFSSREREVVAETLEGMGVVAPREYYRPLSRADDELWPYLSETEDPREVVVEARQALEDGFPATALKLGKDLWAIGGERQTDHAYELLNGAYASLRREVLRVVLRVHRENRDLPSVDILENEG